MSKKRRKASAPGDGIEDERANLERLFPNLRAVGYEITSPKDSSHNCIAYAMGDKKRRWCGYDNRLLNNFGYYWPPDAKRGSGIDELVFACQAEGYEICSGGEVEPGFEKIALYIGDSGKWTHAAKQRPDGRWESKIGIHSVDIIHRTPHALCGSDYGQVIYYMRRPTMGAPDAEKTGQTRRGTSPKRGAPQ